MDSVSSSKITETTIRTTNSFGVLHNLEKDQPRQIEKSKMRSHKSNVTNKDSTAKEPISSRTSRYKKAEDLLPEYHIPVVVNGCVPCNTYSKFSENDLSAVKSGDSDTDMQISNKNGSLK